MRKITLIRSLLFAFVLLAASAPAFAQVGISVTFAPPEIPVYEQPVCPGDGYLWTPGYWAWDGDAGSYYWVPGTWILAPEVGFLWTPGYWGWGGAAFLWHEGFWGPTIGFYGGINYGFGYFGNGFVGGRWDNGHFFYNRAVFNVNVNVIHNVYDNRVDIHNDVHVAYNGGNGGINARATAQEEAAEHDRHMGPVAAQTQHIDAARSNPELRASANHGRPPIAATSKPGDFKTGAVAAREGSYKAEPARGAGGTARTETNADRANAVHPKELPAVEHPAAPNTGNPKLDQKYQKDQDKLVAKQNQDRLKLQAKQDKEHAQLANQKADQQRTSQLEQKHQQQTQQMVQQHTQQRQQLEQRQAPASHSAPRK
jgi:hypothetical protein